MSGFIEQNVDYLEERVTDLEAMIFRLAKAMEAVGHTKECYVTQNQGRLTDKSFTVDDNGYPWFCYCKNKTKHHKRCMRHLQSVLESSCDCGYKEIKKALEG